MIFNGDWKSLKTRKPHNFRYEASFKIWHRPTLPHVTAVPSALAGLTSLFGMGRGGHRRYRHLNIFKLKVESLGLKVFYTFNFLLLTQQNDILLKEVSLKNKQQFCLL